MDSRSKSLESLSEKVETVVPTPQCDESISVEHTEENKNVNLKISSEYSKVSAFTNSLGRRFHDDDGWSVSFEQFLASVLTEQVLCEFFDRKYDIMETVTKLRSRHAVERQTSSTSSAGQVS